MAIEESHTGNLVGGDKCVLWINLCKSEKYVERRVKNQEITRMNRGVITRRMEAQFGIFVFVSVPLRPQSHTHRAQLSAPGNSRYGPRFAPHTKLDELLKS